MTSILRTKKAIFNIIACFFLLLLLFQLFQLNPIPVNQDEFLPVFSKSFLEKSDFAKGSLSQPYSKSIFGKNFPVISYPYVGSLKGLLYYLSQWPSSVTAYRLFNLFLLLGLTAALVNYADNFRPGNRLIKFFFIGFLLGDISFLVLALTDEGPILLNMFFGVLYIRLIFPDQKFAWWKVFIVGFAVFLGVWDRLNFAWFIVAGLGSSLIVLLIKRNKKVLVYALTTVTATIVGLGGVYWLVPSYYSILKRGASKSIALYDFKELWDHGLMLSDVMNPFSAYHRYINVNHGPTPFLYNVYEGAIWLFFAVAFCYGVFFIIKSLANKEKATAQYIYIITVTILLVFLIIKTRESWSSHHIIIIRPFLFLAVTLIAIDATAGKQVMRKFEISRSCNM